jgi:hypothetical protein
VGTYATTALVQARIPTPALSTTSQPTLAQVDAWIDTAEGRLHATLAAAQISTPITDADGIEVMRHWALLYAVGWTKRAMAAAGNDGDNDAGKEERDAFEQVLKDILAQAGTYGAMLSGGDAPAGTQRIRSHVTHHPDGHTVVGGDFAPSFNKRDGADQW